MANIYDYIYGRKYISRFLKYKMSSCSDDNNGLICLQQYFSGAITRSVTGIENCWSSKEGWGWQGGRFLTSWNSFERRPLQTQGSCKQKKVEIFIYFLNANIIMLYSKLNLHRFSNIRKSAWPKSRYWGRWPDIERKLLPPVNLGHMGLEAGSRNIWS